MARLFPDAEMLLDQYALPPGIREKLREGLSVLLAALEEETGLNTNGRARALHQIHDDLRRLTEICRDRARYPQIAAVEIRRPLFILGLPRCGTSLLHALIGSDPQVRTPLQWEVAYPSPPPDAAHLADDPRIARFEAYQRLILGADYGEVIKGHPIGPMMPQECGSFMTTSFQSSNVVMLARLPRYYAWFKTIDARFRYEVHKMWLQHLGWRAPRRHWALKIQEHMYTMPALRAVYPDAIFVQAHRDPATVIASISQLIRVIRAPGYDAQDAKALGREMLHLWHDGLARLMSYRRAHPDLPIHDLSYRDLIADPAGAVRGIYDRFGWVFGPASAAGIRAWLSDNPAGKHGARAYGLAEFGLTEAAVRAVYADYIETYRAYL